MELIFQQIAFFVCIYCVLTLGLNVTMGYAGVISLAHVSFYGIGAYASSIFSKTLAQGSENIALFPSYALCIIGGVFVATVMSALAGVLLLRLRGDYFVMVTFAFSEAMRNILAASDWSGGNLGVHGIPSITLGSWVISNGWAAAISAATAVAAVYWLCGRIEKSRLGLAFNAVREDEEVAMVTGHWPAWLRLQSFVIAGGIAGLAGAIVAPSYGYIDPNFFGFNETVLLLAAVTVGASSTRNGSIFGAALVILLSFSLSFLPLGPDVVGPVRQLLFAVVLLGAVIHRAGHRELRRVRTNAGDR